MSDYFVSIKIAGELASSFKSSIQAAKSGLLELAEAAKISGIAMTTTAKDISASGTAIKSATKDIGSGGTAIKSAAKDIGVSTTGVGKKFSVFKSSIQGAQSGLAGLAKVAGKIGSTTMKVAAKGIGAATATVGGLATAAINVGKDFEAAMSQVSATMLLDKSTTEGQAAFETLENAARECGATTAFSATEAAEALNYLALAGYDANKAAGALPTVLNLAGAGAMDLAAASDMVTDSMSALKIDATEKNLKRFSDQLAQTASKSNTSVSQLGEAIIKVGGTASGLAGGTTELNTALGILADNGIKAAEGGTHLRNMIMSLQKARNKDAGAMFDDLGLEAYDKATGKMRGLGDIFGDLNKALNGASAEKIDKTLSTIFKQTDLTSARAMLAATTDSVKTLASVMDASLAESGTSMAKLGIDIKGMAKNFDASMSQQQFTKQMRKEFSMTKEQAGVLFNGLKSLASDTGNRFGELSAAIKDSKGACEDMYNIQNDNLAGDLKALSSAASDLGISFYKDAGGPIREVTKAATDMVTQLNKAYKSGGMSSMVAEVGSCMGQIVNGIAQYAPMAVNVGIDLIQNLINGIATNSGGIASAAGNILTTFVSGIFSLAPQIALTGIDIVLQLANSLTAQAPQLLNSGTQAITNFVDGLMQRGPEIASTALNLVQTLANGVIQNAPQLLSSGIQLIGGLFSGTMQMLPQLTQIGIQLIDSLTQGIQANLPKLIPAAMQALVNFSGSLRTNASTLVDAGLNLVMTLAQSLIGNIPVFIQTIPTIVTNIAGIINDNAPKLLSAGLQLVVQLLSGIIQAVPTLIANIPQIIQAVVSVFTAFNWMALGSQVITFIGTGIRTAITNIPQIFSNFIQTAHSIVTSFSWQSLGRGIILTISNGIESMITSIPQLFMNIGNFAVQAIKSIDWWNVGITIIQLIGTAISGAGGFIVDAIKGIGGGIIDGIKGIFGGGDDEDAKESGKSTASSYASGIMENTALAAKAASSMGTNAFSNMNLLGAETAGQAEATAFTTSLDNSINSSTFSVSNIGLDTNTLIADMSTAGTESGTAFSNSFAQSQSLSLPDVGTLLSNVSTVGIKSGTAFSNSFAQSQSLSLPDTSTLTAGMSTTGTESANAFSNSFAQSLSLPDTNTLTAGIEAAGAEGAAAIANGFTNGDVTVAVNELGTKVNTNFDATWQTANTSAKTAMQTMNQTISASAQQMISTIKFMSQSVVGTIQQMGSSIQNLLSNISLQTAGTNMMQGLVNGINSMRSQVETAAKDVAKAAAQSVNSELQIHSPSRLMIKSGQYVDEGLAVGMKNNSDNVRAAAQAAMTTPVISISERMQSSITHPIADAKEKMQTSRVREALNHVMEVSAVHNNTVNNQSESEVSPTFVFSPTYQIQGNASKDDIVKVNSMSQAEFEKHMKEFMRKDGRVRFA